jgi:hypothetical protein
MLQVVGGDCEEMWLGARCSRDRCFQGEKLVEIVLARAPRREGYAALGADASDVRCWHGQIWGAG